jgi:acetoin utilization deacetylase AcuC-like enzyme
MKTFYTPAHLGHRPLEEFERGRLAPAVEVPERAERVRARIEERKLGPILAPQAFDDDVILGVHDADLVAFLGAVHGAWQKLYGDDAPPAIPSAWPARGMRSRRDGDIEAQLGAYCFDTATPVMRGTWTAARAAVNNTLSAAAAIEAGERSAFALTRPPGHHASADVFGGYCYLNNAAIAADWLARKGRRVAILDVDYHHGNGTQSIFYARRDVLFVSIHADPNFAYPHFLGFADESGDGGGEGFNHNLPLPRATDWTAYREALAGASDRIKNFGADILITSLGLDTFEDDPIALFKLKRDDYLRMGEAIAGLKLPTLFNFEGGYDLSAIGEITVNVLEGFEGRAR